MASTPDLSSIFEVASCDSVTYTKWSAPNKDHLIWYQSFGSWYRFYPIRHFFPSYFDVSFSVHVLFYNLSSCCFVFFSFVIFVCSSSIFESIRFRFHFRFRSHFRPRFHFFFCLFYLIFFLSLIDGWSVCALFYSNSILFYLNSIWDEFYLLDELRV